MRFHCIWHNTGRPVIMDISRISLTKLFSFSSTTDCKPTTGSESTSAMECEEGLSTNSEAASRASEEQEEEEEEEQVSMQGEGAVTGEPQGSEETPGSGAAGDAGPADSSNDAQAAVTEHADESTSGSSEGIKNPQWTTRTYPLSGLVMSMDNETIHWLKPLKQICNSNQVYALPGSLVV